MPWVIDNTRRFLLNEDGPTATEYAVMLALMIMVCLVAIGSLGTKVSTMFVNAESNFNPGSAGGY